MMIILALWISMSVIIPAVRLFAESADPTTTSAPVGERGQSPQQLLYGRVMNGYSRDVTPTFDGRPVEVTIDPTIETILHVSEDDSTVKFSQWLLMWWTDDHFKWDPAEFNDQKYLYLSASDIWQPDITAYEFINCQTSIAGNRLSARVSHDGIARINVPLVCTIKCPMKLDNFPFGEHNCTLRYLSWMHPNTQIKLTSHDSFGLSAGANDRNREWNVTGTDVQAGPVDYEIGFWDIVTYSMTLTRDLSRDDLDADEIEVDARVRKRRSARGSDKPTKQKQSPKMSDPHCDADNYVASVNRMAEMRATRLPDELQYKYGDEVLKVVGRLEGEVD